MSQATVLLPTEIAYVYDTPGEIICQNIKGLTFFLYGEAPIPGRAQVAAPKSPAPFKVVEATHEVEIRQHTETATISEMSRVLPQAAPATFTAVEATHEVEVRRHAEHETVAPVAAPAPTRARGTGPLPELPAPGQQPAKGWFNKLFSK